MGWTPRLFFWLFILPVFNAQAKSAECHYGLAKSIWAVACGMGAITSAAAVKHRLRILAEKERALIVARSLALEDLPATASPGLPSATLNVKKSLVLPSAPMRLSYQYEGLSPAVLLAELQSVGKAQKWWGYGKVAPWLLGLFCVLFTYRSRKEFLIQAEFDRFVEQGEKVLVQGLENSRVAKEWRCRVHRAIELVYTHARQSEFKQFVWPFKYDLDAATRQELDREWPKADRQAFLWQKIEGVSEETEMTGKYSPWRLAERKNGYESDDDSDGGDDVLA